MPNPCAGGVLRDEKATKRSQPCICRVRGERGRQGLEIGNARVFFWGHHVACGLGTGCGALQSELANPCEVSVLRGEAAGSSWDSGLNKYTELSTGQQGYCPDAAQRSHGHFGCFCRHALWSAPCQETLCAASTFECMEAGRGCQYTLSCVWLGVLGRLFDLDPQLQYRCLKKGVLLAIRSAVTDPASLNSPQR